MKYPDQRRIKTSVVDIAMFIFIFKILLNKSLKFSFLLGIFFSYQDLFMGFTFHVVKIVIKVCFTNHAIIMIRYWCYDFYLFILFI